MVTAATKKLNSVQSAAEIEIGRFENQRGPFVVAADNTRMPMIFVDASSALHTIVYANDSFERLMGYLHEEPRKTTAVEGRDIRTFAKRASFVRPSRATS